MPRDDAEALRDYMRVGDARNLEEYLERFDVTLSVMQTADAMERIAYELAEDAAQRRGALHRGALRAGPQRARRARAGAGGRSAAARPRARRARARDRRARDRLRHPQHVARRRRWSWRELAVAYRGDGVVGFDLAGGEAGQPGARARRGVRVRAQHDLALHLPRRRGRRRPTRCARRCTSAARTASATRRGSSRTAALTEYVQRPAHRPRDLPHEQRADARRDNPTRRIPSAHTSTAGSTSCSTPTTG